MPAPPEGRIEEIIYRRERGEQLIVIAKDE
jgi:hypothetical protein